MSILRKMAKLFLVVTAVFAIMVIFRDRILEWCGVTVTKTNSKS